MRMITDKERVMALVDMLVMANTELSREQITSDYWQRRAEVAESASKKPEEVPAGSVPEVRG